MNKYAEIEFVNIKENKQYIELVELVAEECFEIEHLKNTNTYLNVILTNPHNIKEINKKYRNIDKETDVLSFPMFQKEEIDELIKKSNLDKNDVEDVIGDIVVSIERVKEQAKEYNHSFDRELAYMVVHGFYHIIGYDHMVESDKKVMREKEEYVLNKLNITRE